MASVKAPGADDEIYTKTWYGLYAEVAEAVPTATALVEYAAERGIANIQVSEGKVATNYLKDLAEGKIDLANGPFILPFLMSKGAGPETDGTTAWYSRMQALWGALRG